jgi:hypothetical protein
MDDGVGSYDDLQLRIERNADGSYRVLASTSDGRTARCTFESPVTDGELDDFVHRTIPVTASIEPRRASIVYTDKAIG